MARITKAFTMRPAAAEQLVALSELTGLTQSEVVSGAIEAVWAVFATGGLRDTPSVIETIGVLGRAGKGFYISGERKDQYESE